MCSTSVEKPSSMKLTGAELEIFVWGADLFANLLVYTNFYTHTQTHVSIHTQKISIFHDESLKLNVS